MNFLQAYRTGFGWILKFKRAVFLAYLINLLLVIIPGFVIADRIQASLGHSQASLNLVEGYDDLWYKSFSSTARGLASTFHPTLAAEGALWDGLDRFLTGNLFQVQSGLSYLFALYWLLWIFLSAGFINLFLDREQSLFTGGAIFFFRFLVLGILAAIIYWLILGKLYPYLNHLMKSFTRETTDERIIYRYAVIKYAFLWGLIYLVNIIVDYSKVMMVFENHRNILKGISAAFKFISKHLKGVLLLYLLTGLSWLILAFIYGYLAPGIHQSTWSTVLMAFLFSQLYILLRIATRCWFYSGEAALVTASTSQ
ncbi:MAG: hypothetical protein D6748_13485 [Calditrichaeota bacterium]|nr:MAG: hypothetical protein D6748_13485 [Calditrichota bacterium]